jgi:hypothetical protein
MLFTKINATSPIDNCVYFVVVVSNTNWKIRSSSFNNFLLFVINAFYSSFLFCDEIGNDAKYMELILFTFSFENNNKYYFVSNFRTLFLRDINAHFYETFIYKEKSLG